MPQEEQFNITPEQFARVSAAMQAKGMKLSGTSGEIKEFGADVKFSYADPLLRVEIISAPHFHNMADFCCQIRDAVQQLL